MPLDPSRSLHFESWEKLRQWLPEASENQLLTIFVWAGEMKAPTADAHCLAQVRREAFELIVQRSRDRLNRFLVQRCGCRDVHLADDVVQQVLVKIYLRAEQFDPARSCWGWLYRIARNEYIDTLRRLRPGDVGIGQAGQLAEQNEQWLDSLGATTATPENDALEREQQQRLTEAIAALPRLQRSIVELKLQGIKGKEIAQRLGISQAYVSQLYHEATEILSEAVE